MLLIKSFIYIYMCIQIINLYTHIVTWTLRVKFNTVAPSNARRRSHDCECQPSPIDGNTARSYAPSYRFRSSQRETFLVTSTSANDAIVVEKRFFLESSWTSVADFRAEFRRDDPAGIAGEARLAGIPAKAWDASRPMLPVISTVMKMADEPRIGRLTRRIAFPSAF